MTSFLTKVRIFECKDGHARLQRAIFSAKPSHGSRKIALKLDKQHLPRSSRKDSDIDSCAMIAKVHCCSKANIDMYYALFAIAPNRFVYSSAFVLGQCTKSSDALIMYRINGTTA